jgi:hypothetical protein
MNGLYYIGLDVHKKHVSYVIKTATVGAERLGRLDRATLDRKKVGKKVGTSSTFRPSYR